jgi:IS5 family transposase
VRALAREGRKLAKLVGEKRAGVRDRSRAMGQKLRGIARTIRRRSGDAMGEVLKLTKETGELLERSVTEARRLAAAARRRARGRGAKAKLNAAEKLNKLADRCEKVARQIRQRLAGEQITDRIVSLADPDARPIRKGKIGQPTEFGYVSQLAEVTEHTKPGARGLILPASHQVGNPSENTLLPGTVTELTRLGIKPREVAVDGGVQPTPTNAALAELGAKTVSSRAARNPPPDKPNGGWRATEPARRARSVISTPQWAGPQPP